MLILKQSKKKENILYKYITITSLSLPHYPGDLSILGTEIFVSLCILST